ncbi:hypothetical protein [Actinoplanes couchii]|uniref:Uncharacterized protein n=1 Tax=Actinoplanes couchii TaxID=403638 RepID=A0ABQ3XPN6_9ACTN|nr:hypothetical protein [Actinoplanes couchii]MDR6319136.1 hypothetical protein [Actinoplanes couchii]GID60477.1 hypothetical protein Aco03nite_088810 [Actinoplanes couchii]
MSRFLRVEATRWVDDEQPGWVEVRIPGTPPVTLVEKAPVLDPGDRLAPDAVYPVALEIPCDVLDTDADGTVLVMLHHDIGGPFRVPGSAVFSR